jgi:hypothetical protein
MHGPGSHKARALSCRKSGPLFLLLARLSTTNASPVSTLCGSLGSLYVMMEEQETLLSRRRACVRCATAKSKCSYTVTENECDRCRRLKRDCIPEEAPRRKKQKQSHRVKALEDKVDTLLSLLGSERTAGLPKDVTTPVIDARRTPATTDSTCSPAGHSVTGTAASSTYGKSGTFDPIDQGLMTMAAAESLLAKYKTVHTNYFPFVVLSPRVDAATLRSEQPFLFLSIMTTCIEGDHLLQRRLGTEFKKSCAERIVVHNERNLELLQGLLVQLGWSHYHFIPGKKQLHMLLQMAIGLVIDLDLDRCPAHRDQRVASNLHCNPASGSIHAPDKLTCRRPPAEIRALLGCYFISSSLATMRKEVAMNHTKWIDSCCRILEMEKDAPTDLIAIALVNARSLVQRIGERFSYDDPLSVRCRSDVLIQMSINELKKELGQLEASDACSSETNCKLPPIFKVIRVQS